MHITNIKNYKDILAAYVDENKNVHGYKTKLAEAAGCQKSFLSNVLNSHTHLTPEHAVGLSKFWNLSDVDQDYFLNLVNLARAGSKELKSYLEERLENLRRLKERARQPSKSVTNLDYVAKFYSSWVYGAILLLTTIPKFRTVAAISKRLDIAEELTEKTLEDLKEMGLVSQRSQGQWIALEYDIRLTNESMMSYVHASEWRRKAMNDMLSKDPDSLHFTGLYTISIDDIHHIRSTLSDLIVANRKMIPPSKEGELVCLNFDFFIV